MSNIVLICLENFQDYILDNIAQLIKLNHKKIYVLTNKKFFINFDLYSSIIILIDSDELIDTYDFYNKTFLDKSIRNGFWTLTSLRFFKLYTFMKQYNINNVFHIENDVILYYNVDSITDKLSHKYMYIPFDSYVRNIASIVYIPSIDIFKIIIDNYNLSDNDMVNFVNIKNNTGLIEHLPIFSDKYAHSDEEKYVSKNFNNINFIFDAAAIGQYIGGVDPRNISGNTIGFVNSSCVIKYNNYNILWKKIDEINRPYLIINDDCIPIFNLHIHCKDLKKWSFI